MSPSGFYNHPPVPMLRPASPRQPRILHINPAQSSESSYPLQTECDFTSEPSSNQLFPLYTPTHPVIPPVSPAAADFSRNARVVATVSRPRAKAQPSFLVLTDSPVSTLSTMPHSHSTSTSSVERVYYDARREARKRETRPSGGRREVVVHNHKTASREEPRRSDMSHNKWK